MKKAKLILSVLSLLCITAFSFIHAQNNTVVDSTNAYGFRIIPSIKKNIYGVAIGLLGSEVVCNNAQISTSHGLNIQIVGNGFILPLNNKSFQYSSTFDRDSTISLDSLNYKAIHNGLLVSSFGTFTGKVNGLSISALSSYNLVFNGVSFNLLQTKTYVMNGLSFAIFNQAHLTRGLQLGIINKSKNLRGFQIGIWNVNGKRSLPLINWCFRE